MVLVLLAVVKTMTAAHYVVMYFVLVETNMHFLIMDKFFNEEGFKVMKEYMTQNNISHTSVKPIPFANIFVPEDVDDYSDATYEKYFDKSIPTVSFGSYALANQLVQEGYIPGGFINENFNIQTQMQHWGKDIFLNSDAVFGTTITTTPDWKNIFIRPVHDTKVMQAQVVEHDNYEFFMKQLKASVGDDFEILLSKAKDILAEYRLFIVNGKVVAHSLYKLRGEVIYNINVPSYIIEIAEELCHKWTPAKAFVMDFAETETEFLVLEVNNINCAGFYAADIPSIVDAIMELE